VNGSRLPIFIALA
jgi:IS30 family transposase